MSFSHGIHLIPFGIWFHRNQALFEYESFCVWVLAGESLFHTSGIHTGGKIESGKKYFKRWSYNSANYRPVNNSSNPTNIFDDIVVIWLCLKAIIWTEQFYGTFPLEKFDSKNKCRSSWNKNSVQLQPLDVCNGTMFYAILFWEAEM